MGDSRSTLELTVLHPLKKIRGSYQELLGQLNDVRSQALLAPLATHYLPWSDASLRPGAVVAILNEVTTGRRRLVLELGAGVSTLFLGRLLRGTPGRVVSVENDETWLDLMQTIVKREGLEEVISFVHAPLTEHQSPWGPVSWYDKEVVTSGLTPASVDVLLVDGPLAGRKAHAHSRYPALPVLKPLLTKGATIFLDDIHRVGEQAVACRWEREFDLRFRSHPTKGGYAVSRSDGAWTI